MKKAYPEFLDVNLWSSIAETVYFLEDAKELAFSRLVEEANENCLEPEDMIWTIRLSNYIKLFDKKEGMRCNNIVFISIKKFGRNTLR